VTLERYFKLSSYTLLVTSFGMLLSTGQLDWFSTIGYSGALVAGWLVDSGIYRLSLSRRATNWLRIAYVPLLLLDWRVLATPPAIVVVHFILFVSAFKLLERKTTRDWLWLYLVAFFELLMAAGMTIDASFLVLLALFLFAAVSTLVSFEIRRADKEFGAPKAPIELWRETRDARRSLTGRRAITVAGFSAIALALILLLAAPLFLAMPRLGRSALGNRLLKAQALSGFSNSVRLGEVAQVKLNPKVVMRVRVTQPAGQERTGLRWRGVTFDLYDGQSWTESGQEWQPVRRAFDGFQLESPARRVPLTEQSFFLEPFNLTTIFAAPEPIFVRDVATLQRDAGDGLWTDSRSAQRFQYRVYSDTRLPTESALVADSSRVYPHEIRTRYLQLPVDRDRRIDDLAAQVTEGAMTPVEIARRIEYHLQTSYGYTLDLRRTTDDDPVADFLFNVRAGHCEYFATAMVLMMRARRIPARLVNGFQMGEYSPLADVYTVRQSDAHSWVEVYFSKLGWVTFDPTPAAGMSAYGGGLMAQFRQYFDAFELFWQERIVGFGTNDQIAMFLGLQRWLATYEHDTARGWSAWTTAMSEWFASWGSDSELANGGSSLRDRITQLATSPIALTLFACMGLVVAGFVWRRRVLSWQRMLTRNRVRSAIAFYQQMLRALERAGLRRDPEQTPREFAASIDWPAVKELTRLYERARFSDEPLAETEVTRIGELLGEVRAATVRRWWQIRRRWVLPPVPPVPPVRPRGRDEARWR